jgi:hypothetical protein
MVAIICIALHDHATPLARAADARAADARASSQLSLMSPCCAAVSLVTRSTSHSSGSLYAGNATISFKRQCLQFFLFYASAYRL